VVLAKCLRDIPRPAEAFASYERLRRARAEKVVAFSRQRGSNKAAPNALARWLRDLMLPAVLRLIANPKDLDWLYGYRALWEEPPEPGAETTAQALAERAVITEGGKG
jgi:FAD-dependent urate hydroxylase